MSMLSAPTFCIYSNFLTSKTYFPTSFQFWQLEIFSCVQLTCSNRLRCILYGVEGNHIRSLGLKF